MTTASCRRDSSTRSSRPSPRGIVPANQSSLRARDEKAPLKARRFHALVGRDKGHYAVSASPLENGHTFPSTKTLLCYAEATRASLLRCSNMTDGRDAPFGRRELIVALCRMNRRKAGSHRTRKNNQGEVQWLWQSRMRRCPLPIIVRSCAGRSSHRPSAPPSSGTTFSFMALLPGLFLASSTFLTKTR